MRIENSNITAQGAKSKLLIHFNHHANLSEKFDLSFVHSLLSDILVCHFPVMIYACIDFSELLLHGVLNILLNV